MFKKLIPAVMLVLLTACSNAAPSDNAASPHECCKECAKKAEAKSKKTCPHCHKTSKGTAY